jgi:hypothetical protein
MAYDRELDEESNFFEEDPAYNDTYFGERLDGSTDSAMETDETDELASDEAMPEAPSADETFGESLAPDDTTADDIPDDALAADEDLADPDEMDKTV